jgi:hypothetical protein
LDLIERLKDIQSTAVEEAKRLMGLAVLTEDALFDLARAVLGQERGARCLELARLAPLTRRWWATSATASLIVGTRALGTEWWSTIHRDLTGRRWIARGTPDEYLAANPDDPWSRRQCGSCLATLGVWVADDAANAEWGMPIDFVDFNDDEPDDRVVLPDGARPGDRFVATWDPGSLIEVHVVERAGPPDPSAERRGTRRGRLGTRLGEAWVHDATEAGWAWGMATDTGPIRLPGEIPGTPTDPFAADLDPAVAERLRAWAARNRATADELGGAWSTKDDLWSAWFRLGGPYYTQTWWQFGKAATAAVDGDDAGLVEALRKFDG